MKKINKIRMIDRIKELLKNGQVVNIKALSRDLQIDRKTVRKYLRILTNNPELKSYDFKRKYKKPSKNFLLQIEHIIEERIKSYKEKTNGTKPSIFSIYEHLLEYLPSKLEISKTEVKNKISYSTFKSFLKENYDYSSRAIKPPKKIIKETYPGKILEIDWAENVIIYTKEEGKLKINILVVKLSYSRYMKLFISYEKSTQTVLKLLVSALVEFKGSPLYLVCDNMKSIVSKNQNHLNKKPILEKHWNEFERDFGVEVVPCDPSSPEQKAKVESAVRIAKKIKAWTGVIENRNHLIEILKNIECKYNNCENGVGFKPIQSFLKQELHTLQPLPNKKIIESYLNSKETRIVKNDYKIAFLSNYYYLPPSYLNEYVQIYQNGSNVHIEHNGTIIATYENSLKVGKHYFTSAEIHSEILKYEFLKRGDNISEEAIRKMAKETVESLDLQYKLKVFNQKNQEN